MHTVWQEMVSSQSRDSENLPHLQDHLLECAEGEKVGQDGRRYGVFCVRPTRAVTEADGVLRAS